MVLLQRGCIYVYLPYPVGSFSLKLPPRTVIGYSLIRSDSKGQLDREKVKHASSADLFLACLELLKLFSALT